MVARVEGIVNGDPVIFQRTTGDQWEAQVPASLNGTYVLEMTAYDEAGNIDHISRYLLMYDPINLCASLLPYPYYTEQIESNYSADVYCSDYYAVLEKSCCRR